MRTYIVYLIAVMFPFAATCQVLQYTSSEVGYCILKDGDQKTDFKWVKCKNPIFIIVDLDKGNFFIGNEKKQLFKITKVNPVKYTSAYELFSYETKDIDGKECNVAWMVFKDGKHDQQLLFRYIELAYCYKMKEQ